MLRVWLDHNILQQIWLFLHKMIPNFRMTLFFSVVCCIVYIMLTYIVPNPSKMIDVITYAITIGSTLISIDKGIKIFIKHKEHL